MGMMYVKMSLTIGQKHKTMAIQSMLTTTAKISFSRVVHVHMLDMLEQID